jgi:hypothetical protein
MADVGRLYLISSRPRLLKFLNNVYPPLEIAVLRMCTWTAVGIANGALRRRYEMYCSSAGQRHWQRLRPT